MDELKRRIEQNFSLDDIRIYLDSLTHDERLAEIRGLPGSRFAQLFTMADKNTVINDILPPDHTPLKPVIFHGKNDLPVFNSFQKRMCRSSDGNEIWGYNHQGMGWLTGPGYYVGYDQAKRPGEPLLDYTRMPYEKPAIWPALKSNQTGVGHLVYGGLQDYMRRVSQDVFIGEATKIGKNMKQYFVLCREPL